MRREYFSSFEEIENTRHKVSVVCRRTFELETEEKSMVGLNTGSGGLQRSGDEG